MLVLTRKPGEKLVIDGGIVLTVTEVHGNRVRIGIEAPPDVSVLRGELVVGLDETADLALCGGPAKVLQPVLPAKIGINPPNPFRKLRRIPR
jgi:carbon storage regulator